jgi:hypothetical protein
MGWMDYAVEHIRGAAATLPMPNTMCPRCRRTGLVRKENVIKGGFASLSLYCGGCGYAWEEAQDGSAPKGGRPSKNPPPDRSRS